MSDMAATGTAPELKLLCAFTVRPVVLALVPAFEQATGRKVKISFALNPALKVQIEAGAEFDAVIIDASMVDDLVRQGKVAKDSQRAFGRIGLGVGVRAGAAKPDVSSVEALKRTLVNAKSIAYAGEGSSGAYLHGLFARLGIMEEVGPKLVSISGGQTVQTVARGDADMTATAVTSILACAPDVELVGYFPTELQSYIEFAAGLSAAPNDLAGGELLLDFLTSPHVDEMLRSRGVERAR